MARSLPVENLLPRNVGQIINYLQWSTEVAQWGAPSCSRPQPATDNGVRDGRPNLLVEPITLHRAVPPSKSQDLLHSVGRERATFGMPCQRTACAATHGILTFNVIVNNSCKEHVTIVEINMDFVLRNLQLRPCYISWLQYYITTQILVKLCSLCPWIFAKHLIVFALEE